VGALAQVLQHTQGLLAANPTALDNLDNDLILREASVNTGVPSHWLVNPEIRDQRREQQQKDAAAQQQAALEQQQAATAVDASKTAETMSKVGQPPQTV
jgi:hypothetical protein